MLFYYAFLGTVGAALIRRDWSCPALIPTCTKTYLVTSGTCDSVAAANGISTNQFFDLNPSINRPSCNNVFSGCNYCVQAGQTPPECPKNYNPKCNKFDTIKTGDICNAIVLRNPPISLNQFYDWNPAVHNPACDNLVPNCKYCVNVPQDIKIPEPHQPNTRAGCKEYYQAINGDYCYKIAIDKGVNLIDFMSWNPDVGSGCMNMLAGYWYCLRI